jgi:DNA-binding NarL/FixJ family response regulator
MHSVVLADDHPLLLRGLQDILSTASEFKVLGAAADGAEAITLIRELRPDIAVLDLAMPRMSGLDILRASLRHRNRLKAIFLTATISGPQIAEAMAMGVRGILLKEYAPEALLDCMRRVANGGKWLPDDLVAKASAAPQIAPIERFALLTAREREIAALICGGLSNRTIAEQLGTSEGTIGIHLNSIYRKLEIANRATLAALYVQYTAAYDA